MTDHYDYLIEADSILQFEKLFEIEFVKQSPIQASWEQIFEPRQEIRVHTPHSSKELNRFDAEPVSEYFKFSDNKSTATWMKA